MNENFNWQNADSMSQKYFFSICYILFANNDTNWASSKVLILQWDLSLDLILVTEWKKYGAKHFRKMFPGGG